MKLHRMLGLVAALVLTVGLLSGCGGEGTPEGESGAEMASAGCTGDPKTCSCGGDAKLASIEGDETCPGDAAICERHAAAEGGAVVCEHAKAGEPCDPATCTCPEHEEGAHAGCEHAKKIAADEHAGCSHDKADAVCEHKKCAHAKAAAAAKAAEQAGS